MAIDPKLLIIKPVSQLQNEPSPLNAKVLMYNGGNELKTTPLDDLKALISAGVKGILKISDAKPAVGAVGKYDLSEAGTYTNLVPIIAFGSSTPSNTPIVTLATDLNSVYWDGTNFTQFKKAIPQATQSIVAFSTSTFPLVAPTPPAAPIQRTHENSIWQLADGQTSASSDVPGVSEKWVLLGREQKTTEITDFPLAGYVNMNGTFTTDSNWKRTDYLNVGSLTSCKGDVLGHQAIRSVAYYDKDKIFISGVNNTSQARFNYASDIPLNASFIIFTVASSTNSALNFQQKVFSIVDRIKSIERKISNIDALNSFYDSQTNVNLIPLISNVGYISISGNITTGDDGWRYSGFIQVYSGQLIKFKTKGNSNLATVISYDESFVVIDVVSSSSTTFIGQYTVPSNVKYVRFSIGNATVTTFAQTVNISWDSVKKIQILESEIQSKTSVSVPVKRVNLKLEGSNVIFYGTSIFSNDYPWIKQIFNSRTIANTSTAGFSGYLVQQLASNACLNAVYALNPDVIISMVGANNNGSQGTIGTFGMFPTEPLVTETDINVDYNGTRFIQAVSHIIRRFKQKYDNFRANANLTGTETETEKTAKIDAVKKPYFVFCTDIPQKRNNANDGFSRPENMLRKRNAVLECCIKYDVHCIDLYELVKSKFIMDLEPYYVGPTNTTTNNGLYYMDGLHPNKYGDNVLIDIILGQIS